MTAEEYARLPRDGTRQSLVAGCVVSELWPKARHGRVQVKVFVLLDEFVRSARFGEVLTDVGFLLSRSPDTVRAPDVAFVRRERAERQDPASWYEGAPDLAVEVLSPGDRPRDVHEKVIEYLAAGGRMVWLVDPERRRVTVYRSPLSPHVLGDGDEIDGEDILPGLKTQVSTLFD